MILVGELALWVALLMAAWTMVVSCLGGTTGRAELVESGERGTYATFVLLVLAALGLWTALLTHDFSIEYVASFTSANLPTPYLIAAFWAGPAGSFLIWALILAGCSGVTIFTGRDRNRALMPYVTSTLAAVLVVSLAALVLGANPFERLPWVPVDGRGLNPQLQNPGMVAHPPNLYLGYAATAVPFAFVVAALITRRLTAEWLAALRRWTLIAWFFLTVGILSGMWWAYVEPGRDGYWVWDPMDNASLLSWLVLTAFVHWIVVQEKRGQLRKWNVIPVVSAFLLTIPGMFVTRGGAIPSLRSFAQSPVAVWFAGFLILATIATAVLVSMRLRDRDAPELKSMPGRAGSRRRYGGHVVHLGVIVLLAALVGLAFRSDHAVTLRTGDAAELRDPYGREWRFVSEGVSRYDALSRQVTAITLAVYRDGQRVGIVTSEQRQYVDRRGAPAFEPSTEAGIIGSPRQDVYIALAGVTGEDTAGMRISFNPLVWWVWIGGVVMVLGGLAVMWPQAGRALSVPSAGELAGIEAARRGEE